MFFKNSIYANPDNVKKLTLKKYEKNYLLKIMKKYLIKIEKKNYVLKLGKFFQIDSSPASPGPQSGSRNHCLYHDTFIRCIVYASLGLHTNKKNKKRFAKKYEKSLYV